MHCCLWFRSVFRVRGPWPKRYGYHLSIIYMQHYSGLCSIIQDYSGLCSIIQDYSGLCSIMQDHAPLFRIIQHFSGLFGLCSIMQDYAASSKINTVLCTIIQDYKVYRAVFCTTQCTCGGLE